MLSWRLTCAARRAARSIISSLRILTPGRVLRSAPVHRLEPLVDLPDHPVLRRLHLCARTRPFPGRAPPRRARRAFFHRFRAQDLRLARQGWRRVPPVLAAARRLCRAPATRRPGRDRRRSGGRRGEATASQLRHQDAGVCRRRGLQRRLRLSARLHRVVCRPADQRRTRHHEDRPGAADDHSARRIERAQSRHSKPAFRPAMSSWPSMATGSPTGRTCSRRSMPAAGVPPTAGPGRCSPSIAAAGPWNLPSIPRLAGDERMRRIGIAPAEEFIVYEVTPGSPAARTGLKPNDQIVALDGVPVLHSSVFVDYLRKNVDRPIALTVLRAGRQTALPVPPRTGTEKSRRARPDLQIGLQDRVSRSLQPDRG